jgi:xylulokinase
MLPHDWLNLQLCGELVTDRGDASGTGYWSPTTGMYRFDILSLIDDDLDWEGVVPRVAAPDEVIGEWQGVRVASGTGDNMAAALGLAVKAGEAVVSLGTSGTAFTVADRASADVLGNVAGFADATGRYLPLVCTLNATKVTDAAARLLGVDHGGFDRLVYDGVRGSDGVTLLPYFDGERTPDLPAATGAIVGMRSDISREQLARASVEGVVCGLLDALDALAEHAVVNSIVLTGGGARSAAYRSVFAELAELPVSVTDADEAVAAGACVQAAAVADGVPHAEIVQRWSLGTREAVPAASSDVSGVRARYAELRRTLHPTS